MRLKWGQKWKCFAVFFVCATLVLMLVGAQAAMSQAPAKEDIVIGLYETASGSGLPLTSVHAEAKLTWEFSTVELVQEYYNNRDTSLEVIYKFPLDDLGAVYYLSADIGGRSLTAVVEEANKARQTYNQALGEGKRAGLLTQIRPDVFETRLGNLAPQSRAVLRLRFVAALGADGPDGARKFLLPTTIAPRYGARQNTLGETDPRYAEHVSHGLSIDLTITDGTLSFDSLNHAIDVSPSTMSKWGNTAHPDQNRTLRFSSDKESMDRDFVLTLSRPPTADGPQLTALAEYDEEAGTCAVMLSGLPFPSDPAASSEAEEVSLSLVVDRSGSMEGSKWEQTQRAIAHVLDQLRAMSAIPTSPKISFNILSFGSEHELMFETPVPADEQHIQLAKKEVAKMRADMGGTELRRALSRLFIKHSDRMIRVAPRSLNSTHKVLVMTDGAVYDTDAVLDVIREARQGDSSLRVFSLGVGSDCSHHLVRSIAQVGGGMAEFVQTRTEDKLSRKLQAQVARAFLRDRPARIDWDVPTDGLHTIPSDNQPVLFQDALFSAFAVFPSKCHFPTGDAGGNNDGQGGPSVPWKVTLAPVAGEEGQSLVAPVRLLSHTQSSTLPIHRLAARALIREWEEGLDKHELMSKVEDIVRFSKETGIISQFTSLVMVEEQSAGNPQHDPLQTVEVPSLIPMEYGAAAYRSTGSGSSYGAAYRQANSVYHADHGDDDEDDQWTPPPGYAPSQGSEDVMLLDVTPLSIGVKDEHGMFVLMIHRNTLIPSKKSSYFILQNGAQGVELCVYMGEYRLANRNIPLFNLTRTDLTLGPFMFAKVNVTLEMNDNGLTAYLEDAYAPSPDAGLVSIVVPAKRVTHEEMEAIIRNAEKEGDDISKHSAASATVRLPSVPVARFLAQN